MKVLVATEETQGDDKGDFCYVSEGELVYFGGGPCDDVSDSCGCRRAIVGVTSLQATTTFRVAEAGELNEEAYIGLHLDAARRSGWILDDGDGEAEFLDDAKFLLGLAADLAVGTVLAIRYRPKPDRSGHTIDFLRRKEGATNGS